MLEIHFYVGVVDKHRTMGRTGRPQSKFADGEFAEKDPGKTIVEESISQKSFCHTIVSNLNQAAPTCFEANVAA